DAERAKGLHARSVELGRAGKFAEAQGPIREILDLYTRVLGQDHSETGDARRELETLQKVAALPEADRAEYVKTYALPGEMKALLNGRGFAAALRPAEQILAPYRRLLGPDWSSVAVAAHAYGQALYKAERYADAETQFRESLRVVLKVAGEDSPAA